MSGKNTSITNRLMGALLAIELLAALALTGTTVMMEHHVRYEAFDSNLRAISNALLSDVQEDVDNTIRLDLHGQPIPHRAVFRVTDETGRSLGSQGTLPDLPFAPGTYRNTKIGKESYRIYTLVGERVIDPFQSGGGIHHRVTIVFGLPDGHVWHEVFAAVRFFAICTFLLLGITAILMVLLTRRLLAPIRALADAAEKIDATRWQFDPPSSARTFKELQPLTSAIEETLDRLQRSFEQQKRFTSDAAHELKTDLSIVKSSLQLLAMKPRSTTDYEQGLIVGLDDLTRLERTVQKMLTLARLEAPTDANRGECRFDEIVLEVVRQSTALASLNAIVLSVQPIDPILVPLDRDDGMLLCSNVLLNAIQHSPAGGMVELTAIHRNGFVLLHVRDQGEGVKSEDIPLLFEPFYRSDPSRSRNTGGTGLGLSICKAICGRVGGTISITNTADAGAEVEIALPIVLHPVSTSTFPATTERNSAGG